MKFYSNLSINLSNNNPSNSNSNNNPNNTNELMPFGGQIQYLSDLHLDHQYWDPNGDPPVLSPSAPYLVIAGDLGNIGSPIFKQFIRNVNRDFDRVIFVPGNHEFYGFEYHTAMRQMKSMELEFPRLKVLLGSYQHQDDYNSIVPGINQEKYMSNNGSSGVGEYPHNINGVDKINQQNEEIFKHVQYESYIDNTVVLPLGDGRNVRVIGTPLWSEIPNDPEIHAVINKKVKDYLKIQIWDQELQYERPLNIDDTNFFHHSDVDWLQQVFWNKLVIEFETRLNIANDNNTNDNHTNDLSLVVSHHTPLVEQCCHPKFLYRYDSQRPDQPILDRTRWCNWAFSTRLNWLIHEMQPTAWVFGHTHFRTTFEYKWVCEVSGFDKKCVIASNPVSNDGTGIRGAYNTINPIFNRVL